MRKKIELPEVEEVKLPHILGMRPGLYISILFAICILLIFFALFMLPGILSDSTFISFDIKGSNIAIYEDGSYLGSSEGSVYRSSAGIHDYEFYYNDYKVGEKRVNNPKHIFFTLFHRSVNEITPELSADANAKAAMKAEFVKNAEAWTKVYTHSDSYNIPPIFTSFAENIVLFGIDDFDEELVYGIMHITSKEFYDDYLNAIEYLKRNNIKFDDSAYINTLDALYNGNGISEKKDADKNSYKASISNGFAYIESYDNISIGRDIISESYPETNYYPITANTDSFAIALRTVTEYEYALFAEENPKWAKSNLDNLISEGLADSDYLSGITLTTAYQSMKPIRNISYYAALAYCDWLSEKSGKHYALPSEDEWYVAAKTANNTYSKSLMTISSNSSSPISMLGGVWEFTRDEYIPLKRVFGNDYSSPFGLDDIIIKGGSYIDSNIDIESIGVIDRAKTSEYVGFRVALYE